MLLRRLWYALDVCSTNGQDTYGIAHDTLCVCRAQRLIMTCLSPADHRHVARVAQESKIAIDAEAYVNAFSSKMMAATYAWVNGAKFSEVSTYHDTHRVEGKADEMLRLLTRFLVYSAFALECKNSRCCVAITGRHAAVVETRQHGRDSFPERVSIHTAACDSHLNHPHCPQPTPVCYNFCRILRR